MLPKHYVIYSLKSKLEWEEKQNILMGLIDNCLLLKQQKWPCLNDIVDPILNFDIDIANENIQKSPDCIHFRSAPLRAVNRLHCTGSLDIHLFI